MFSLLRPGVVYNDISTDITEHDIDVVSDLWNIDGREVYRGSRDPNYKDTHVYWLYDEDLMRVGCTEHEPKNHAISRALWFRESVFGTLLQEDGWEVSDTLWSILPRRSYEMCVANDWMTPTQMLERCLKGTTRIITPSMIINQPSIQQCNKCQKQSLKQVVGHSCSKMPMSFPDKTKILFIDESMTMHVPSSNSRIYSMLGLSMQGLHQQGDDAPLQPEQEPVREQEQEPVPE